MRAIMRKFAVLLLVAALLCGTALAYPTQVVYEDLRYANGDNQYAMLAALGIMEGDGTGNFHPDRSITRGEMAKIVAMLHSGGQMPLHVAETPFADLDGHWAADYVGYCYENGLISGTSETTFSPNATLTDYECTKMLLSVQGYPFTEGDDWREQVNAHINGQYALTGEVWTRLVIAKQVYIALTGKLYQSDKALFEENFGLTVTRGRIVATDELALKGDVQEKGHFVLETDEEGMKTFSYGYFTYTGLGRWVTLYTDANDALVMVFYSTQGWITGGKCDVTVEGQSVYMETPDDWYRRTFTDEEWNSEVPFIHNFGPVQTMTISQIFDKELGLLTGTNTDRVVLGYTTINEQPFLFALSFTNHLVQVAEIDKVWERVRFVGDETWFDYGSLDGAEVDDYAVFSVSGADQEAYLAKLTELEIEVVSVTDGIVETADGSYRIADGVIDPMELLLDASDFTAGEICTVYTLRDIIYVKA